MKSVSYYLTLLVIKLKRVKREFSKAPVNYKRLRKENVHHPGSGAITTEQFEIGDTAVTALGPGASNDHLVIFCHGGAFVYGPVQYHWDAAKKTMTGTGSDVWLVNYPKAPEHKIDLISDNIDRVYRKAMEKAAGRKIILLGDSVGGTLLIALTQRLIGQNLKLPEKLILISPVMDASLTNPEIEAKDRVDPILSKKGVLSAKRMVAGNRDLRDPMLSPLYGSFKNFPALVIFVAENDITSPDQEIAVKKMREEGVAVRVIKGKGMPHIWPVLPVIKEGKEAMKQIIEEINT